MEEIGAQVAPLVFVHQKVSSPFGRKRGLRCQNPPPPPPNWNPDCWAWECTRFAAKPLENEILKLRADSGGFSLGKKSVEADKGYLNLGGGLNSREEPALPPPVVSRSSKRVRSGSPGGRNYPSCLVDNCKEDLSGAKDYHRRHKVCELHSKASKALVENQMQRFCQQCSRFHLLSEFDEGKRSCRRRLAGHNRRRRKTQPEKSASQLVVQGNLDNPSNTNTELVSLLTALACAQGKTEDNQNNGYPSMPPNKEQLVRILDLASKLKNFESLTRKISEQPLLNHKNETNGTCPSTLDLLPVLSATQATSSHDSLSVLSQRSSESGKTKATPFSQAAVVNSQKPIVDARSCLELQLFTSSPENEYSPRKLESSQKYFSSGGSKQSLSSSPVMQDFFPVKNGSKTVRSEKNTNLVNSGDRCLPLELFSGSNRGVGPSGYTSLSVSDHSRSSSSSDAQDRTGRIVFKLFGKKPDDLPGRLRSQMYSWLSNYPSEMESYIRPGCVVLSVYVSMSSFAWELLEKRLRQCVTSLVQDSSDSDFWRKGRFLVNAGRRLASYENGKIRLCKSGVSWSSPQLIIVSPLAIVPGQETTLLVKGRNLINVGTKIHCAFMGKYTSVEVTRSTGQGSIYQEISLSGFKVQGQCPRVVGRCFIEVENGLKGNGFPLIIADAAICRELKHLEYEFTYEHAHGSNTTKSRDEALNFLNELGWLFQRKKASTLHEYSHYSLNRFKFLLVFSTERGFTTLTKTILDMMVGKNSNSDGLTKEAAEMLAEIKLLSQAVKRRCAEMTQMLIHYSIRFALQNSKKYIFPPNSRGPGGLTPLHLAACASGLDDIVDILTNDPQQIGLSSWNSLLDANGQSPRNYAITMNNQSYNTLVAGKLADKRNDQVSVTVLNETGQSGTGKPSARFKKYCETCGVLTARYRKAIRRSKGFLFQAPTCIHPVLAVAAVCVCVCLLMRALPNFGRDGHFKWEGLAYGTS